MDAERAEGIARKARAMGPKKRADFLRDACGDDVELRAAVDALLDTEAATREYTPRVDDEVFEAAMSAWGSGPKTHEVIGPYALQDKIGEGGFGVVWLAEQTEPIQRKVALKVIKLGMDTAEVIKRFEAERQALALMDHPSIAKVYDAGTTPEGRPFFVMELVDGIPIDEYCSAKTLSMRQRIELFVQVCQAIQHAHQKGIIHRDIKPNNVLVAEHDGVPLPKVIDFGIAKATGTEAAQRTMLTEQQQIIGTPEYMSPEQVGGAAHDIDTRADIYSLGVMLYELLTGTRPFDAKTLFEQGFLEMIRVIKEEDPPKPSTRVSSLGDTAKATASQLRVADSRTLSSRLRGDIDWIVMKCLSKERDRRYESANGLAADLLRHLNDEPVLAGPPSAKYRFEKFVRRNRAQVVAASLVLAALVLGFVGTLYGLAEATEQAQLARDAQKETERELGRANAIKSLITKMLRSVSPSEIAGMDKALMQHVLADASRRLDSGAIEDDLVAAELSFIVGSTYLDIQEVEASVRHLESAYDGFLGAVGEDARQTLQAQYQLGRALSYTHDRERADRLVGAALDGLVRNFGENDRDAIAAARYVLAGEAEARLAKSSLVELVPRFEELVARARSALAADDPVRLLVVQTTIAIYESTGDAARCRDLAASHLESCTTALGAAHPTTIRARADYGKFARLSGDDDECERVQREGYDIAVSAHGKASPLAAQAAMNLAYDLEYLGQYEAAERVLAPHIDLVHLRGLDSLNWGHTETLGRIYLQQGHFEQALRCYEVMKEQVGDAYGGHHHVDEDLAIGMARALEGLGRHDDARPFRKKWRALMMGHGGHGGEHDDGHAEEHGASHGDDDSAGHGEAHGGGHGGGEEHGSGHGDEHGGGHEAGHGAETNGHGQSHDSQRPDGEGPPLHLHSAVNAMVTGLSFLAPHTPDLHDPERALTHLTQAYEFDSRLGGVNQWRILEHLAYAQHHTGDDAAAAASLKRGLGLIPERADESIRARFRERIAEYESPAADDEQE